MFEIFVMYLYCSMYYKSASCNGTGLKSASLKPSILEPVNASNNAFFAVGTSSKHSNQIEKNPLPTAASVSSGMNLSGISCPQSSHEVRHNCEDWCASYRYFQRRSVALGFEVIASSLKSSIVSFALSLLTAWFSFGTGIHAKVFFLLGWVTTT